MARGIYKRGNVYWIRYGGPDGKIRYESSNSYRYRDAEILLTKRKQQMLEGRHPEILKVGNHKFSDLVPEYLKWAQRQKSFTSKRAIVMKLNQQFGDFPLRKIGPLLLEKYQTQMLNQGKRPATVNRDRKSVV